MKFLNLAMIASVVSAEVGLDCAADASVCDPATECCGAATPKEDGTEQSICNDSAATEWVDVAENAYAFACPSVEEGAMKPALASISMIIAFMIVSS